MADQGSIANLKQNINENIYDNTDYDISGGRLNTVLQNVVDTLEFNGRDFFNVNEYREKSDEYANAAAARAAVPDEVKKIGLVITYLLADGWYKDQFKGSNTTDWDIADNWVAVGPITLKRNPQTGFMDFKQGKETTEIISDNERNLPQYVIEQDVEISSSFKFITPVINVFKGNSIIAYELEILEKTFVANTDSIIGIFVNNSYYNYSGDLRYSNKIYGFIVISDTTGFRLFIPSNSITTAGKLKARLKLYPQQNNIEKQIFDFSINQGNTTAINITPALNPVHSRIKVDVLENTCTIASGYDNTYLVIRFANNQYQIITLKDGSAILELSQEQIFNIQLRSNSSSSSGKIVLAISYAPEEYEELTEKSEINKRSISDNRCNIVNLKDVVGERLLTGGETTNKFGWMGVQNINYGFYNNKIAKWGTNNKRVIFFPIDANISNGNVYFWNRFDGESQSDLFVRINFFVTKNPINIDEDYIEGSHNPDFIRGYLRDFDAAYKYLYLGFVVKEDITNYDLVISRAYSVIKTVCYNYSNDINYFTEFVDYYKDKYVKANQGTSNTGKPMGVNNNGLVEPMNIEDVGGLNANMGSDNAGKTLIINDNGDIIPGNVTPSGVIEGVVQLHESNKLYLGADILAAQSPEVVLGNGWSGDLVNGFSHQTGNTEELTIQYSTVSGKKYVVGLQLGSASEATLFVKIGDLPQIDTYNGSNNPNIGIKSQGGYLSIIPASSFNSTVSITLKEIVDEESAESELVLTLRNINHGNMINNITGFWNIALGGGSMGNNQNGSRNIAIGQNAMNQFQTGTRNQAIGTFALSQLLFGDRNTVIGSDALWFVKEAVDNVVLGYAALGRYYNNAEFDAKRNICIGTKTMNGALLSAYDNIAIGYWAGQGVSTNNPTNNVAIGTRSGRYAINNCVAIGHNAGYYTTGEQNVAIGAEAGATSTDTQSNSIAIGYNAKTTKSNQCVIGNNSVTEFILGGKKLIFNNDGTVSWE